MKIVLDTNRYSDLCANEIKVIEFIQSVDQVFVPLIVLAELRAGFALGKKREQNEKILTRFLNTDGISILAPDQQTTFFYADLYLFLRKKGTPIPTNDLWIAALTLQHNLYLFDRDSDFNHIPQLLRAKLN